MKKRVIYVSLWSMKTGLAQSTVMPSLEVINSFEGVSRIDLISPENRLYDNFDLSRFSKLEFSPVQGGTKLSFKTLIKIIIQVLKLKISRKADLIICKGSQAGAIGVLFFLLFRIPFVVESFEPHADYMADSGCWKRNSIKFLTQKLIERMQKAFALSLGCVSNNYLKKLVNENVPEFKLYFTPCPVDLKEFEFDPKVRSRLRKYLEIDEDALVGIYVGKFGGLYYEEESFEFFSSAGKYFKNFELIIITDFDWKTISQWAAKYSLKVHVINSLPHNLVNSYLCVADFAFTNVKPGKSKLYCCPIKNGEYFACGLPVVISEGIGDDSKVVEQQKFGVVTNANALGLEADWIKMEKILESTQDRTSRIRDWVEKNRSITLTISMYQKLFFC